VFRRLIQINIVGLYPVNVSSLAINILFSNRTQIGRATQNHTSNEKAKRKAFDEFADAGTPEYTYSNPLKISLNNTLKYHLHPHARIVFFRVRFLEVYSF
jgi:hypothetical protein